MKAAVCDDEKYCVDYLKNLLEKSEYINHVSGFTKWENFKEKVDMGISFDVIFMDIEWKNQNRNGIDYAEVINLLSPTTQIVYVT